MGPIILVARREQRTPTLMSRDGNSSICLALSVEYSVLLSVFACIHDYILPQTTSIQLNSTTTIFVNIYSERDWSTE
jgi:hypothetical protein